MSSIVWGMSALLLGMSAVGWCLRWCVRWCVDRCWCLGMFTIVAIRMTIPVCPWLVFDSGSFVFFMTFVGPWLGFE